MTSIVYHCRMSEDNSITAQPHEYTVLHGVICSRTGEAYIVGGAGGLRTKNPLLNNPVAAGRSTGNRGPACSHVHDKPSKSPIVFAGGCNAVGPRRRLVVVAPGDANRVRCIAKDCAEIIAPVLYRVPGQICLADQSRAIVIVYES